MSLSVCHLLNDMNQSLVPALYPILKDSYRLDFGQIGLITLASQLTASMLQPVVGMVTDRRPQPYSLPIAMGCSLIGLLLLAVADNYPTILLAAALVGVGSSVFHPESSRVARMASGGRHGFAQSLFQVGGSTGSAIGPLLAAFIVVPRGQGSVAWFSAAALLAILLLTNVSLWYSRHLSPRPIRGASARSSAYAVLSRKKVLFAIAILVALLFSKNVYTSSLSSYYTFYLIHKFGLSVQDAQIHLFVFLGAVAAGTFAGGPIGDRFGRKPVIWFSIVGAFPFALVLPYAEPVLDRHPERGDRPDPGLRVLGDPGLCAGPAAGPGRHGRGDVLRLLVRTGRAGGSGARPDRRLDQHRDGLPAVLVPAADRAADRVSAEYRTQADLSRPPGHRSRPASLAGTAACSLAVRRALGAPIRTRSRRTCRRRRLTTGMHRRR